MQQWMMVIQELLLESEQLRLEDWREGPQDELEYWKVRAARLSLLVEQVSSAPCRITLNTLRAAQSRLLRVSLSTNRADSPSHNVLFRSGGTASTRSSSTTWRLQTMPSSWGPLRSIVTRYTSSLLRT